MRHPVVSFVTQFYFLLLLITNYFSGKNCTDKRIVKVPVNTTVTELEPYIDYEDCFCLGSWDHPFQKKVAKVKHVTKIKLENVTKVINFEVCCEGWEEHEERCFPKCHSCSNGNCTAPFTCTCAPGFTGRVFVKPKA